MKKTINKFLQAKGRWTFFFFLPFLFDLHVIISKSACRNRIENKTTHEMFETLSNLHEIDEYSTDMIMSIYTLVFFYNTISHDGRRHRMEVCLSNNIHFNSILTSKCCYFLLLPFEHDERIHMSLWRCAILTWLEWNFSSSLFFLAQIFDVWNIYIEDDELIRSIYLAEENMFLILIWLRN